SLPPAAESHQAPIPTTSPSYLPLPPKHINQTAPSGHPPASSLLLASHLLSGGWT
ncbi:hypothetical protein KUCAC02_023608, partial [Chaenocephalus aceratus]